MKVLVTGAGALLGQGIIRSLLAASNPYDVVAADPSPLSAGLYWTDKRHLLPMAKDPAYLDALSRILDIERPDAVCVGTDVELGILAEAREALERQFDTHVIVSSPEVVAIADDKYLTYRFLTEHGLEAPKSCLVGDERRLAEEIGFPLIVKPRIGARSIGVSKVETMAELEAAVAGRSDVVIQECVATDRDEYTAGVIVFDGRCEASIVMRRDLRDGNTFRAYVEDYPELNAFVRSVAEALNPYGPANFQFRLADSKPKIFEINGRFSGTTPLRMLAGFNEVEMVLRHVVLGEPIVQPAVKPMTILRYFTETVVPAGEEVRP